MIYRQLGQTKLQVSVIGVGTVLFEYFDYPAIKKILDCAVDCGVNLIDVFNANSQIRSNIGKAMAGRRDKFIIQGHLGTMDENGQNVRVRDIKRVRENFERMYHELNTDYIDIGTFFYIDSDSDYDEIFNSEVIEYALKLKEQGRISSLSMSSHNPRTALKAVQTGLLEAIMLGINPAYDMEKADASFEDLKAFSGMNEHGWQVESVRQDLYLSCEQRRVGITVMKPFAGGTLLEAETSPFGQALTVIQCCHYALTRPAVSSILVGCHDCEQLLASVAYIQSGESERDFGHIFTDKPKLSSEGRCMYCNHCQPCPSFIDIASVTKFLNLAQVRGGATDTVRDHYFGLEKNASDCVMCGQCEDNCPFGVDIRNNMEKALAIFHEPYPT